MPRTRSQERKQSELVGKTYTRLTVVRHVGMFRGRSHYACVCECGRDVVVDGSKLVNGHTKSCGCYRVGLPAPWRRKAYGESTKNRIVANYFHNAKAKGIEITISAERVAELLSGHCFYCGCAPSAVSRHKRNYGEFVYNGIDRLNNEAGYVEGNIVSCCVECNFRKGATNAPDFLAWVRRVAEHGLP